MATLQLYDQLLQFPLFQGMSRDDLVQVAGHTRFDFQKYAAQKTIVGEGDACTHFYFLLSGTLGVETCSDNHSYRVVEQLSAPYMLQAETVFGYYQRYTHTYRALTPVNVMRLDRQEVMRLSEQFLVFRINLLNLFATQSQKCLRQVWRHSPRTLDERIVRFFVQHCIHPAGPKVFYILMTRLADELNDSRLDVSRALNRLQAKGMLSLHRGRIEIPQMEYLLMNV